MPTVKAIMSDIEKLTADGQEYLLSNLEEMLLLGSHVDQVSQGVMEHRFSKGSNED